MHDWLRSPPLSRPPRRPADWQPPGPAPRGSRGDTQLFPREDEDLSLLSGDWAIFQLREGHRWSLDDLVAADTACTHAPPTMQRALDLGCGIGSVLMMVAWSFPEAELLGVEAQARSVELLRRSLRFNGAEQRVRVVHADLREHARWWSKERFDLITGTPPYLPIGTGTRSRHSQCDSCRFELRGGIEAYCEAAALALATDGRFVFCEGDTSVERVPASLEAAGLTLLKRQAIHGRVGKPPLFHVFVAAHASQTSTESTSPDAAPLCIRDQSGARTPEYVALRRRRGLPE